MHSRYKLVFIGLLAFSVVCLVIGTVQARTIFSKTRAGSVPKGDQMQKITYRVTGTASHVLLTYKNPKEGQVLTQVTLPWEKTVSGRSGDFAFLSAESCDNFGSITTEILVDGAGWKKTTADPMGTYALADCDGFLGPAD